MGFFSKLFGGGSSSGSAEDRFVKKHVTRLLNKYGQKELREDAMHALYQRGSHESVVGLMQRFTYNHPESIVDEKEKKKIIDLLDAIGAERATPAMQEYLANDKQTEVSMALIAFDRIEGPEKTIREVISLLEDADPDDPWSGNRKIQLIGHLDNYTSNESIQEAVPSLVRFLQDIDDDVVFRCVELLEILGEKEAIRGPFVDLLREEETSARIRARILEVVREKKWYIGEHRKELEPLLPEGYYFDRRDNLKKR